MRYLTIAMLLVLFMSLKVEASEVVALAKIVDGNTLISCSPATGGEFDKAFLILYENDGNYLAIRRREMDVSYDNEATYILEGTHDIIEGKCKFFMSEGADRISRGEFKISMR